MGTVEGRSLSEAARKRIDDQRPTCQQPNAQHSAQNTGALAHTALQTTYTLSLQELSTRVLARHHWALRAHPPSSSITPLRDDASPQHHHCCA